MDATTNGYRNETSPLALEALHAAASELPLEVILKLRPVYRAAWEDASLQTNPDYHEICDTWLRSLDTALWRHSRGRQTRREATSRSAG